MTTRARLLTPLLTLVVLLAVAGTAALASPDGDDDNAFNAGSGFGTRYTQLLPTDNPNNSHPQDSAKPVTDQAPDGSSVTAVLIHQHSRVPERGTEYTDVLHLSRLGIDGLPTGFGTATIELPTEDASELLDIRVLSDGRFIVLVREGSSQASQGLIVFTFSAAGALIDTSGYQACGLDRDTRGYSYDDAKVKAARVEADGRVSSLWDCIEEQEQGPSDPRAGDRQAIVTNVDVWVVRTNGSTGVAETLLSPADFGEDLELGPNGDPFALTGRRLPSQGTRGADGDTSNVFRLDGQTLLPVPPDGALLDVAGLPVDLAVDSQSRPLVWTHEQQINRGGGESDWHIYRLLAGRSNLDPAWGGGDGEAVISDPRLDYPYGQWDGYKQYFLTVRPGDKVLATGQYQPPQSSGRAENNYDNGIIAGLTSGGDTDTGFATAGFKVFSFAATDSTFLRIGEPTLQSDGKILIPHVTGGLRDIRATAARIASPPSNAYHVGVTRLGPTAPAGGSAQVQAQAVRPSATPTICGRRAISLVRADVRGKRVKLTGLVGAALYGKNVTIQTDPKGSRASKFTKTTTVKASKSGSFTAFVPKPKAADFVSIRYRAKSGSATSPSLKLPQRLTSRSVKSAAGTITVKGRVKKSVLGKRNRVKIRRLVCGRYRTVGTAKPDANGNYTVTFKATEIRGVAFYRAESMVLRKAGSKRYVIQYARAIAIKTTSQTG